MASPAKQMARQQQTLETVQRSLDDLHAKMDLIGQALGLVKTDPAPADVAEVIGDEPLTGEPLAEVVEEPAAPVKKRSK